MKLSLNFTLEELIASGTAAKYGLKNTPNEKLKQYLTKLATDVLQPIRDAWGTSIIVSSGLRVEAVNKKVGGATNSDHKFGCAADIHTKSDSLADNKKLYDLIVNLAKKGVIKCRLIIWEYGKKNVGPSWIHVSINNEYNSKKNNQLVFIGI